MDKILLNARKQIILDLINSENYVPMKIKEMAIVLNVAKEDRGELEVVLNELIREGLISVSKRGKYSKPVDHTVEGIFIGNNKGFGFVTVEGEEEDIFIPENGVHSAMHKDRVRVLINPKGSGKRREGEILSVLEHEIKEIIGTYQQGKNFGFVIADNNKIAKDIYIPSKKSYGAVTGHKVLVRITDYGDKKHKPEGEIIQIIGHMNDPGVDILSIAMSYELPFEFPEDVMKQVENIPSAIEAGESEGRLDIRDWQTVTIDGEDAKDLDDAITLTKEEGHYILGVHIADVTHYVKERSPLDTEAVKRGTSVYLVDRVIPMLPHKLSNGICSLNQGVDRLALSCIMEIDETGSVLKHKIAESVINVDRRMTYTSVKKILEENDQAEIDEYKELVPMFEMMGELAKLLRNRRRGRGSIDFDFPESKIVLDEKGSPVDVKAYDRNTATKIIEDFMLIANETVAETYYWQEIPFVYRIHETPESEKMIKLATFINNFGYSIKLGKQDIHPKELQKLLDRIEGSEEEALISRVMLRSMKQAKYSSQVCGHFGLAAKYYCHFTSPIRRYPDLQIHRIIKENIAGKLAEKRIFHYADILPSVAQQCSKTERRAEEAERETIKLKKVEFMSKFIGEVFEGVISGVTKWGLYVELPNTIEGMVHISTIPDDYYNYDEERYELVGEATNKRYKLGQKINVKLINTDIEQKNIDFEIVEWE